MQNLLLALLELYSSLRASRYSKSKGWFEPENVQDASVFLLRANKFLREHLVEGIQVVENVVKTQSYVAFLRMSKLASLLTTSLSQSPRLAACPFR